MVCKLCQKKSLSISQLIRHCNQSHTEKGVTRYSCPFDCDRMYCTSNSFRKHVKDHLRNASHTSSQVSKSNVQEETPDDVALDGIQLPLVSVPVELKVVGQKSFHFALEEFKDTQIKEMIRLLADESLPRNKALEIVKRSHATYTRILSGLYQYHRTHGLIDEISTEAWSFLCEKNLPVTEYKCVEYLKEKKLYVGDIPYNLDGYSFRAHQPDQTVSLKLGMHMTEIMDLIDFFTKLFQLPNFLDEIIEYNDSLDDPDWISNITQTKFWKDKVHDLNLKDHEVALPLFIYFDEFEPLNALGSHSSAYKLGGVYMNIPCLSPSVQSQLKYIFLAMLFFACDLSIYGNTRVFAPLITQLNKLQAGGIKLNHSKFVTLKLLPILFIGDNLGLNTIFGFCCGFNANYYCRFCKNSKAEMQKLSRENKAKMRDKENYETDCQMNDFRKIGIKEKSVFNDLKNFHVVCNPSVDLMHDLLEGVCHVIICALLFNFIFIRQLFTLKQFNTRLKNHYFGPLERNTNIPFITPQMLKNYKIRVSASEMFVLFTHFAFIIGDLVDADIPEWNLYLLTREILAIVVQKKVHRETPKLLRSLISEHHELFKKLFIKNFTPKMHFELHYPNIMEQVGPLCHVSSMRFESYHKIFKNVIKNINCRKNLLKSCLFKLRMRYANFFVNFNSFFDSELKTGKLSQINRKEIISNYRCDLALPEVLFTTTMVEKDSVVYKVGYVLQTGKTIDDTPEFALISNIRLSSCSRNPRITTRVYITHNEPWRFTLA